MHALVFLSHASQDKEIAQKLYADLEKRDVSVWASFKNIRSGAEWNKAIQDAMNEATHIVILVSKASIESSYVLSEVEYALDNKKVVIPLLFEKVKLPLRWHTLEYVDCLEYSESKIKELAEQLPKSNVARLEQYLSSPHDIEVLKEYIRDNPQWIHPSVESQKMLQQVITTPNLAANIDREVTKLIFEGKLVPEYFQSAKLLHDLGYGSSILAPELEVAAQNIDIVGYTDDSAGKKVLLVFLCSPYVSPFGASGALVTDVKVKLNYAATIARTLRTRVSFRRLQIYILAGQRKDYDVTANKSRNDLETDWPPTISLGIDLHLASYSRLIEKVRLNRYLLYN